MPEIMGTSCAYRAPSPLLITSGARHGGIGDGQRIGLKTELVVAQQNADIFGQFDPVTRAAEKQAARARDEQSLTSGTKSRAELQHDNGFIRAEWGLRIDLRNAPIAG